MRSRPDLLGVVLGTTTGAGKTWATAQMARSLALDGFRAFARKPAQSYAPEQAAATDAHLLAAATGETAEDVCPRHRWYELPLAPPMAAVALGRPAFGVGDLVAELAWPEEAAFGLVETVGGPRSPIASDGDSVALATALSPDAIILVADAGLGAVNAVRLSVDVLLTGCAPVVVLLNRWEATDVNRRNRDWLRRDGYELATSLGEVARWITHRRA